MIYFYIAGMFVLFFCVDVYYFLQGMVIFVIALIRPKRPGMQPCRVTAKITIK